MLAQTLYAYVQTSNAKSLKHDFSSSFAVLRGVEGWFSEQEEVLFWFATEVSVRGEKIR